MDFVSGGATGIGLLFEKMFGLKLSVGVGILNVIMFILGLFVLGKRFAATTLLSTFLYPGFLAVMETMPALATLNTDPIVAAVFGGASIGIGVGLVIRMGSSTGGMDIPPIILQKYTGIAVAISMNAMDLVIMATQMPYSTPQKVMYSLVMLVVTTIVMDKVAMLGVTQTQVMVVSSKYMAINKAIHDKIDRGTTLLNATSGHLQQDQKVVMSIINNRQLHELTQVVKEVDPHAFLIVNRINEVHGNGFTIKLDDKQRIEALKNR
jgi:uncharacterized membrane-anchored protein YitT (DUF2179 family)